MLEARRGWEQAEAGSEEKMVGRRGWERGEADSK
jgi:hypothetical protein